MFHKMSSFASTKTHNIMSLQVGQAAPQFTLVSSALKSVALSDFKGRKVVIHFFPLAFTGVCTTQLCTMRDSFGYYDGLNATILGISVDSPFTLAKFKEENNYQFDLLSDFNKEVSAAYGALYQEFVMGLKGVSKRAAFVIDEEQNVIYAEVLENAGELPDFAAIAEVVK
ncbi:Peroxiredoxin [Mucilaginibacter pineti]|uniref:Peroxiredoxin n=2 Tax=Mucilaginibacter pineti TaxID=1391627 RepID=A0A1G7MAD8_9SPHI|nr:Peroxiredoxin [Mucilaginibacter pineti]